MIRFINLGDQIYCDEESKSFAFFDTVTDTFINFEGVQYFDDWEDFCDVYSVLSFSFQRSYPFERLKRLTPPEFIADRPSSNQKPWDGYRLMGLLLNIP